MGERKKLIGAALAALPLAFALLVPLEMRIGAATQTVAAEREELLLRSPALVKRLSLGYETLVADIYWTRAVQYYGSKRIAHDPEFQLLGPLLDMATQLDPQLLPAYRFGAIFLAEKPPWGAGRADLAVDLLKRGIAANPGEWRLWADLGFLYYWDLKDYKNAADAYYRASRVPGAREWTKAMAAHIGEKGGSRQVSQLLWSELYESTKDANIRRNALAHLQTLKAEEDAEHLAEYVADFARRKGRMPLSLSELVTAGLLPGLPLDPAGFPYRLAPGGKIALDPKSPIVSTTLRP